MFLLKISNQAQNQLLTIFIKPKFLLSILQTFLKIKSLNKKVYQAESFPGPYSTIKQCNEEFLCITLYLIFKLNASNYFDYIIKFKQFQQKMNFLEFSGQNFYNAAYLSESILQLQNLRYYSQPILIFPNAFESGFAQNQGIFEAKPSLEVNLKLEQEEKPRQQYFVAIDSSSDSIQEKRPKKLTKKKVKMVRQTPFRNVKSNILKYFLKYVSGKKYMAQFYLKNIEGICDLDYKTFMEVLWRRIPKNKNYVKPAEIRQVCLGIGVSKEVGKAFRILFRKFMTTQFVIIIQHLKRIETKAKLRYVQARIPLMNEILKTSGPLQEN